jgi:ATP-binding cassette subfamily F protein 3
VRVLSGGERTRLAVARMLLRPSNTLLLDEPTNHLDLDSKDVLLDALEDFGGTLIFVSHDRYFVDKLASKVIEIGDGHALLYPGNYEEWLWSRKQREAARDAGLVARGSESGARDSVLATRDSGLGTRDSGLDARDSRARKAATSDSRRGDLPGSPSPSPEARTPAQSYEQRKRQDAEARRAKKLADGRRKRIEELEARIADRENAIKEIEASMSAPGFYDNREAAQPLIDKHQSLMWEVGDLMNQWEALLTEL